MTAITLEFAQNVNEDNYTVVLEPVRAAIAHTETYAEYCAALQPFTRHQRLLMALDAYTHSGTLMVDTSCSSARRWG